jgi:hypothetical protein
VSDKRSPATEPQSPPPNPAASSRRRTMRLAVMAGVLTVLAIAAAACGSGSGGDNASSAAAPAVGTASRGADSAAAGKAPAAPAADPSGGSGAGAQPEARIAPSQALIRRAELTVRVKDVKARANDLVRIAADNDGDVFSDNRTGSGEAATADVVLKVPPTRLDAALATISRLGTEVSRTTSSEDVTEDVADVESRVASMKASIARVRAILSRASSVGDVVSVEGELSRREAELESLQARQRTLAGQIAQSTLTVHLLAEKAVAAAAPPAASHHGFGAGLRSGWNAFAGTVGVALTALGAVLPFLLIVVPILGVAYFIRRNRASALDGASRSA